MQSFHGRLALVAACAAAAVFTPVARAAPPANDDRAAAAAVPAFPASLTGTLADATVERLDPQVSACGQIDATVWYRIDQAPDGAIVLGVQGALAPVIRVYRTTASALKEVDCASAGAGGRAQVAFESVRGAAYLVIVGRKPTTTGTEFTLDAKLFLPPANDSWKSAQPIGALPWKISASTLGATVEGSGDPEGCSLDGGTVWYTLTAKADGRIALKLTAAGDLDAAVAVQSRSRSERETVGCARTDKKGNAALPIDVTKGTAYLVVVGNLKGSSPGNFTLQVLAAQAPEQAPGTQLAAGGVSSSVNGLTDVNDVWWRTLTVGETYRISFHSTGCPSLLIWSARTPEEPVFGAPCNTYRTFTPGPDGGGRYLFEVRAPRSLTTQPYTLVVARAALDDTGLGIPLGNLQTRYGSLAPSGVDVVDRFYFDIEQRSDVRLSLRYGAAQRFGLLLMTEDGGRVAIGDREIHQLIQPGRYMLAVAGVPGSRGGAYAVKLVVRRLTSTTIGASATTIRLGSSVTLHARTSPPPDGAVVEMQIDRFDPLGGWVFNRMVKLHAAGGSYTWRPPAIGRWRARAAYVGNVHFDRSGSSYVYVTVK
jgi:hypothetical protein